MQKATDDSMFKEWKMVMESSEPIFPPMLRIQVIRGFLFNHSCHHRGEIIVYLRSTGNIPPGLYGPIAGESRKMAVN